MRAAQSQPQVRPPAEERAGPPDGQIGERLRAERERLGLSLRKVAGRLSISPSALSQIETGRSRPSVRTLYALVSELGISFDSLFGPAATAQTAAAASSAAPADDATDEEARPAGGGDIVQRASSRKTILLESGVIWERLNPVGDRDVDFLEVTYDVGGASSPGETYMRHSGREYGVVLSGHLKVTVGFDDYELGPGDSICFDSSVPHRLATMGDEPAKAIWIVLGRLGSDVRGNWPQA
jgi:transcriptional regulator with XRE-family HTH domain